MINLQEQRLRFLLVEENENDYIFLHQLCEEAFGNHGHIRWVCNFEDAIAAIDEGGFDIFLFDHSLKEDSDFELIARVKNNTESSPPAILLTSIDDHEIDMRAMHAGAADYLIKKHLTAKELERSVRYALQHKKDQDHLIKLAHYDSLTGLANRKLFHHKLADSIHQASRSGKLLALFLLDLDNFKDINDTEGHPTGDLLLVKASARIRQAMRETDTVARLGGDEFAVVASNLDDISDVGILAKHLISAFDQFFLLDTKQIPATTSIGIATYPNDSTNEDELLKQCDLALYDAKRRGRNTYSFFNKDLDLAIRHRQNLQAEMATALINNDFLLYYQPIIDANSGHLVSVEALMRWQHPEKNLIPPDQFIPIAESSGFIVPLGDWMIREACRQKKEWLDNDMPDFPIAINLAAKQFYNDKLLQRLNQCIKQQTLNNKSITLEITESTLMENTDDIRARINKLYDLGYSFSLDDFGTGYSSLAYLKRFPVDKIKIDRSMVADTPNNKENCAICEAIVSIGNAFGIKIIAEGVETQEQLEYLRSIGCDQLQGYLISKPLSAEEIKDWIRQDLNIFPSIINQPNSYYS